MKWSFAVPAGPEKDFDARVRDAALKSRPRASEVELEAAKKAAQSAKTANVARDEGSKEAQEQGVGDAVTVTVPDVDV